MNNGTSLHRISCLEELLSTLELFLLFLPTDLFYHLPSAAWY